MDAYRILAISAVWLVVNYFCFYYFMRKGYWAVHKASRPAESSSHKEFEGLAALGLTVLFLAWPASVLFFGLINASSLAWVFIAIETAGLLWSIPAAAEKIVEQGLTSGEEGAVAWVSWLILWAFVIIVWPFHWMLEFGVWD
jgi:hypothetical protein